MKIRICKSGEILDVESRDYWVIFQKTGLIEFVAAEAPARKLGTAKWWVNRNVSTESQIPTVIAHCDACGSHQVFAENLRLPDQQGNVPPSTMGRAFLEHCRKREKIPADILKKFHEVREEVTW